MQAIVDFFLHMDDGLRRVISEYGGWTYALLFLIVFCETGLVVTPFLPGDTLLFAAGIFAGTGDLNLGFVYLVLIGAALTGDNCNYFIGQGLGHKLFKSEKARFFKPSKLAKTHAFFEKYGGKTIILARFVPVVRTFAPFVAGMSEMTYAHFIKYCIIGACIWVGLIVTLGYYFGNNPFVKQHFEAAMMIFIVLSLVPPFIEYFRHRAQEKRSKPKSSPKQAQEEIV